MFRIFNGATAHLQHLTCHASTLSPGRSPHPPHQHSEEELLLLLAGEVDLLLPDATPAVQGDRLRLKAGEFVYYPAQFSHTLKSVGVVPANYLMFKWHNHQSVDAADAPLDFDRWPLVQGAKDAANEPGFHPRVLFNKPTRWLRKLHCHTTTLAPDAGYNPHVDAYDVAIVVLEGEIETLGERARPYDVIFYPAGEPHGMHNPGSEPARYVVFEFHGRVHPIPATSGRGKIVLFEKLVDLRRWKRRVQNLTLRLRKGK